MDHCTKQGVLMNNKPQVWNRVVDVGRVGVSTTDLVSGRVDIGASFDFSTFIFPSRFDWEVSLNLFD